MSEDTDALQGGVLEQGKQLLSDLELKDVSLVTFLQFAPLHMDFLARSQPCRGNGTTKEIRAPH